MGSLTSRPKAASQQQIVNTPIDTTSAMTSAETAEADPTVIAKARAENVLRRSRSALGTVLTSFRGVLSGNNNTPQRKSLLGE